MKRQINEIKRMQHLAGLITESEYRESLMNEAKKVWDFTKYISNFDPKDMQVGDTVKFSNDPKHEYYMKSISPSGLYVIWSKNFNGGMTVDAEHLIDVNEKNKPGYVAPPVKQDPGIPLNQETKQYVDERMEEIFKSGEDIERLKDFEFFEQDFEEEIVVQFADKYDSVKVSSELRDYIQDKIS